MNENNKQKTRRLSNERNDITPLLGKDWLKKVNLTIRNIQLGENIYSEKRQITQTTPDSFKNDNTSEDTEINSQL